MSLKHLIVPGEVRQISTELPYTVTEIGGKAELESWRRSQSAIQAQWLTQAAETHDKAVDAYLAGSSDKSRKPAYARNKQALEAWKITLVEASNPTKTSVPSKILNWFLNFNF